MQDRGGSAYDYAPTCPRGARIKIFALAGFCRTTLAIQALVKDLNAVWQFAVIVAYFISRYAALQGWRQGVHSRSLGGTEIGNINKKWEEMPSIRLGIFFVSFWIHDHSFEQWSRDAHALSFASNL